MYIDLFAGCGGLSLGLQKAGWKGLFAIEKNDDAFNTLNQNLIVNGSHFSWPQWLPQSNLDINFVLREYRKQLADLQGQIQLLVGGPPCQGFSMAGTRTGNDVRNRLYNSYLQFVKLVQPEMLFFENVHGFTVGFKRKYKENEIKSEAYSEKLIRRLKRMGYKVAHKEIIMSEFGVPQNRKRFILFAIKNGDPNDFFKRLYKNIPGFLSQRKLVLPITTYQAIGDLERRYGEVQCPDSPHFFSGLYGNIHTPYQELMRKGINLNDIPDSHRFAKPRDETIELFRKLMMVSDEAIRITPRMNLVEGLKKRGVTPLKKDTICPTITSIPDDFIHYSEARIMTVRECARIQSFPDDYVFTGKYTTGGKRRKQEVPRYTQVANAVPPLFAEQVGIALKEMIKSE